MTTRNAAAEHSLSDLFAGRGSLASRSVRGKQARRTVPRAKLAECKIDKRDPIALLEASNVDRVPELTPIRYGRMLANPFAFYRGAAPLMAFDLSKLPRTDIIVQLGGDAHLANFGLFASPERRILFGPNDFDETLPGPFDWDLRRLAASFVVAARERGFLRGDQRNLVRRLCETFRQRIAEFSKMDTLDVWYYQFKSTTLLDVADSAQERKKELAVIDKARLQSSRSVMGHSTEMIKGKLRIKELPPLVFHIPFSNKRERKQYDDMVRRFFADYRLTLPEDRGPCSTVLNWSMSRCVWSGSARWECVATKHCSWPTENHRYSCSSRRRAPRCWRAIFRRANFRITASAWS
jgi:hypothetical protein